jgi:hypothetical protein
MRTVVLKLRQSIEKNGLETVGRAAELSALVGIMLACLFAMMPIV